MRRALLARSGGLLVLVALLLNVVLWACVGRLRLHDQAHLDHLAVYLEEAGRPSALADYFLCASAYEALSKEAIEASRAALSGAGADLLTVKDLGPDTPAAADCDCFATCYRTSRSVPLFGAIDRIWRPEIGYSESGSTTYYAYLFGWHRIGSSDTWSQW